MEITELVQVYLLGRWRPMAKFVHVGVACRSLGSERHATPTCTNFAIGQSHYTTVKPQSHYTQGTVLTAVIDWNIFKTTIYFLDVITKVVTELYLDSLKGTVLLLFLSESRVDQVCVGLNVWTGFIVYRHSSFYQEWNFRKSCGSAPSTSLATFSELFT